MNVSDIKKRWVEEQTEYLDAAEEAKEADGAHPAYPNGASFRKNPSGYVEAMQNAEAELEPKRQSTKLKLDQIRKTLEAEFDKECKHLVDAGKRDKRGPRTPGGGRFPGGRGFG